METQVDVVLGTWGVDPPIDDHLTFSCRLRSDGAIAADAALTVDGEHASLGRLLTRAEALTHPRVEEFWAVVDFLAEADPTIRAGIQGDDQPAWPFDQGPDVAAFTVQAVLAGDPILHVSHDEDDHGWQFLDGRAPDVNAGRLIRMSDALARDPSLRAIADLPPGWIAWRTHPDAPWQRGAHPS